MYGWEAFLSERDKLHDLQWGKKELSGFGSKPALVLIDMYYSVVGLTRAMAVELGPLWAARRLRNGWVRRAAALFGTRIADALPDGSPTMIGRFAGLSHEGALSGRTTDQRRDPRP